MCKIFALTSTAKLAPAAISDMIARAHKELTATQRDGWGFQLGSYHEKWDEPNQWPGAGQWPAIAQSLAGLAVEVDCITSGEMPAAAGPAILAHARTATCSRGAVNAHPHHAAGWAVVHNGIVESKTKSVRSCDSMHIADSLAKHGGPSGLAGDLTGYLAILAVGPQGQFVALRDDRAPLWVAKVAQLDAWAFASSPELVRSIIGPAFTLAKPYQLRAYTANTLTAEGWTTAKVTPWASSAPSWAASKAFGDSGSSKWPLAYSGKGSTYGSTYGSSTSSTSSKGSTKGSTKGTSSKASSKGTSKGSMFPDYKSKNYYPKADEGLLDGEDWAP